MYTPRVTWNSADRVGRKCGINYLLKIFGSICFCTSSIVLFSFCAQRVATLDVNGNSLTKNMPTFLLTLLVWSIVSLSQYFRSSIIGFLLIMWSISNQWLQHEFQTKLNTWCILLSCQISMGKQVPCLNTRGVYPIFHKTFVSK